jgi:predicted AlkP superfamily phosphohydrolase/phosphomutase
MSIDLLIVGLDGLSHSHLTRILSELDLPNLAGLARGKADRLLSLPPYATPAVWTSILSGVGPPRHGVLDFTDVRTGRFLTSARIDHPRLWDYVDGMGWRGIWVCFPMTHPAQALEHGIMVSGLPTPPRADNYVYPREIAALLQAIPDFAPEPVVYSLTLPLAERVARYKAHLSAITEATLRLAGLESKMPTRVIGVQFQVIDIFQHVFWPYIDPTDRRHSGLNPADVAICMDFYNHLDACIGRLIRGLAPDRHIALSDHGFGPIYENVQINQWLLDHGWAARRSESWTIRAAKAVAKLLRPLNLFQLLYPKSSRAIGGGFGQAMNRVFREGQIDFERSRAFCLSGGYCGLIKMNSPNRSDSEALARDLMSARHPTLNEPLFASARTISECYPGAGTAFDDILVLQPAEGYAIETLLRDGLLVTPPSPALLGTHRPDGVLLTNLGLSNAENYSALDIAPTILDFLGIDGPGLDGRSLLARADQKKTASARKSTTDRETGQLTPEEEQAIAARLQDLGYL